MGEEPEDQSEAYAEGDRSCDWEVEGGVFAAVDDVAGEAAEAEREFAGEVEESARGDEDAAEDQEGTAEVAGWIHGGSLAQAGASGGAVTKSRSLAALGMTIFC